MKRFTHILQHEENLLAYQMKAHGFHSINVPKLGSGLDESNWLHGLSNLVRIFGKAGIQITIFNIILPAVTNEDVCFAVDQ